MPTPPIRDVLIVNDLQPGSQISADATFVEDGLRVPSLDFILQRIPNGGTYQLTTQPEPGFTMQMKPLLVGPPPQQQFTQWQATTAGASTIPLSRLINSMLFRPPAPDMSYDFAMWLQANGWQLRFRWPTADRQPGDWTDWYPAVR